VVAASLSALALVVVVLFGLCTTAIDVCAQTAETGRSDQQPAQSQQRSSPRQVAKTIRLYFGAVARR